MGIGAEIVDELLHRLPPDHHAWAQLDSTDTSAIAFARACGGELCGGLSALRSTHPIVALALAFSAGGLSFGSNLEVVRFAGRGTSLTQYDNTGRLLEHTPERGGEAMTSSVRLWPQARASRHMPLRMAASATEAAAELGFPGTTRSRYTWRGHSCAFVAAGEGPPVLLLHGFAGSAYNAWRSTLPALAANHRVYALDLLGLGASAQPSDVTYGIELWREQAADFIRDQMGDGQAPILIGHSFGSLVALEVAASADAPSVRAIGMMNCGAGLNNKNVVKMAARMQDTPGWQIAAFRVVLHLVDAIFNQRWLLSLILERFATAENVRGALESSVYVDAARVDSNLVDDYLSLAADRDAAVEVLRQIYTNDAGPVPFDAADKLPDTFPLLCLWGDDDKLGAATGPVGSYFEQRASRLEASRWELLPACGHVPQDDAPQKTNAILCEWLATVQ